MKKSQSGFTLVELVVVILVLGILSATALPRFMNVSSQAHSAAVSGVGGGFASAVAITKAQWIVNGSSSAVDKVANFGEGNVSVNASGWPINTGAGATADFPGACVNVWNGILQNPPSISTGTGSDYLVTLSPSSVSTLTGCTYQYQADTSKGIIYSATNGAVTISQ
jgi:prepilin-type N-terminal cleavage/methylation domain-containing protein